MQVNKINFWTHLSTSDHPRYIISHFSALSVLLNKDTPPHPDEEPAKKSPDTIKPPQDFPIRTPSPIENPPPKNPAIKDLSKKKGNLNVRLLPSRVLSGIK